MYPKRLIHPWPPWLSSSSQPPIFQVYTYPPRNKAQSTLSPEDRSATNFRASMAYVHVSFCLVSRALARSQPIITCPMAVLISFWNWWSYMQPRKSSIILGNSKEKYLIVASGGRIWPGVPAWPQTFKDTCSERRARISSFTRLNCAAI